MQQRWIVTTSGDRPAAAIAEDLARAGFRIEQTLGEFNVLIGRADQSRLNDLRSVPGVADVAADAPIDIGPPDPPTPG